MALPRGAVGWSEACDCGTSSSDKERENEREILMSRACKRSVCLPEGAVGWSAVSDCVFPGHTHTRLLCIVYRRGYSGQKEGSTCHTHTHLLCIVYLRGYSGQKRGLYMSYSLTLYCLSQRVLQVIKRVLVLQVIKGFTEKSVVSCKQINKTQQPHSIQGDTFG